MILHQTSHNPDFKDTFTGILVSEILHEDLNSLQKFLGELSQTCYG